MNLSDLSSTKPTAQSNAQFTTQPVAPSIENLPNDVAILKALVVELLATLREERNDKAALRERLERLLHRIYGPRTERFDPNQPLLFPELAAEPAAPEAPPQTEPKPAKRKARPHGRRRLPEHLPREPRHHHLTEAERLCPDCGQVRIDIGADTSEQLEYRPASLIVIVHHVHKYACPCGCRASAQGPVAAQADLETPAEVDLETLPNLDAVVDLQTLPNLDAASNLETRFDMEPHPDLESHSDVDKRQDVPRTDLEARPESVSASEQGQSRGQLEIPTPIAAANPDAPAASAPLPPPAPRVGVVVAAAKPQMPIAKGLPGPGLLAHLIVSKCVDHLPLHRLERIYERQGYILPRSTTCDWLAACADLLKPLYQHMVRILLQSRVIHTDDTPVKMQLTNHQLATARLWTYLGDEPHPYNVFDFTINRRRDGPQTFLANFQGYLQADAFSGYDGLYLPHPADGLARIVEVACNAHARRKFYEARSSDALRSHQALAYYRQLYELERGAAALNFDEAQRLQMRRDLAVPILEQFRQWLDAQRPDVLPKSPLGEAVGYALNNWPALVRYTEAGCLAIDNNVAEREMKKVAIGRKNWLFVGSKKGGHTLAVLLSFTSTCQRLGVEPWAYLRDVLTRLPTTPADRLAELLPDRWKAAQAAQPGPTPSLGPHP
jgi:transposase